MKKLLLLMFMAAAIVWAQPREFEDDDALTGPTLGGGRLIENLDLTADQEKQFDKLRTDMQKKQIETSSKIQTARLDIKDLFREDNPDKGKIESKMSEISKLQNEMKMNHIDFWFVVNKILKPEQQKIWKEHRMMMGKGMGNGHMQGMPGRSHGMRGGRMGRGMDMHDCSPGCCK